MEKPLLTCTEMPLLLVLGTFVTGTIPTLVGILNNFNNFVQLLVARRSTGLLLVVVVVVVVVAVEAVAPLGAAPGQVKDIW